MLQSGRVRVSLCVCAGYLCKEESGCRSESCCSAVPRPRCRCRCLLLPPRRMVIDLKINNNLSLNSIWEWKFLDKNKTPQWIHSRCNKFKLFSNNTENLFEIFIILVYKTSTWSDEIKPNVNGTRGAESVVRSCLSCSVRYQYFLLKAQRGRTRVAFKYRVRREDRCGFYVCPWDKQKLFQHEDWKQGKQLSDSKAHWTHYIFFLILPRKQSSSTPR